MGTAGLRFGLKCMRFSGTLDARPMACTPAPAPAPFGTDVLAGLAARRKVVPARYLYDAEGSRLFEAITHLPEYYPTRTEISLLSAHAPDIARLTHGVAVMVEFGSGSSRKTPILLDAIGAGTYIPIDVAGEILRSSAAEIAARFPGLLVLPVEGDFTRPLDLPVKMAGEQILGFFPGSTIGNLGPAEAVDLLRGFARLLGPEAWMLIGIDTRKPGQVLKAAYDDAAGVTAAFNKNLIARINRELGGTIPADALSHRALWNEALGRVEMHLVAQRAFAFEVAGRTFHMRAGETIHTENSYKYRPDEAAFLARASHWEPVARWTDAKASFSIELWQAHAEKRQP